MAKNLVATDTSLELYQNDVLLKTFPRGEIKTQVTNTNVRVSILKTGDVFSLYVGDSVNDEEQTSKEEIAKAVGAFSIGGGNGVGVVDWDSLENKPPVIGAAETEEEAREKIGAGTSNLELGETEITAFQGDLGKEAYEHSQESGNPHGTTISDIEGLQDAIDEKQPSGDYATVSELPPASSLLNKPEIISLTTESTLEDVIAALKA